MSSSRDKLTQLDFWNSGVGRAQVRLIRVSLEVPMKKSFAPCLFQKIEVYVALIHNFAILALVQHVKQFFYPAKVAKNASVIF